MSSVALALLLLAGTPTGPMPDGSTIGTPPSATPCTVATARDAIVVCGHVARPSPRLPLPEERGAAGEVRHHAGDAPVGDPGPPREPNRLLRTILNVARHAAAAVQGVDPDQP